MFRIASTSAFALLISLGPALSDVSQETVDTLGAPESVETRIGTLAFRDGVPTDATARRVFETLDFTRALNVYNNRFRGASALGLVKGFQEVGAGSGDIVIFEELMDSSWTPARTR